MSSLINADRIKLHKLQKLVHRDWHRFRVIVAGRRWGKTQISRVSLITAACNKSNQIVWYVAPTYQMARDIMWEELKSSLPKAWVRKINETRMVIYLINGSRIHMKGADKPDTLRGVGLHFLVIDEAQDIAADAWWMVLSPTLASTGGRALIIGTPKSYNWLYDVFVLGQRGDMVKDERGRLVSNEWKSWQFKTITSPFVAPKEIVMRKRDMDPKSFKQEFEACHLPDTRIRLWTGGTKAISDVRPGDMVVHVTDSGERVPTEVLNIGETGEKTILDVVLETGETLSATAHHRFKVHNAK